MKVFFSVTKSWKPLRLFHKLSKEMLAVTTSTLHTHQGINVAFGIVGVPVTPLVEQLQKEGVKFYAMRNEQAASYAASVYGYLTGTPALCITVAGPGEMGVVRWLTLRRSCARLARFNERHLKLLAHAVAFLWTVYEPNLQRRISSCCAQVSVLTLKPGSTST